MHNKKFFVTYGDNKFEDAKKIITKQAELTGEFDEILSYGPDDISVELRESSIINIQRGAGLWSWKPDVIYTTIEQANDGDIIVYADSACTIQKSKEWKRFWKILKDYDIIAQRIYQRTDHWTRKELIDHFPHNGSGWTRCYQYGATIIILKVSSFTRLFIKEWRDLMITNPLLAMDVSNEDLKKHNPSFRENRHDQAIYSALIYKYLKTDYKNHIYSQWEHFENLDPFFRQAIRATRLRKGEIETKKQKVVRVFKRLIKEYVIRPFYYSPRQFWYSKVK